MLVSYPKRQHALKLASILALLRNGKDLVGEVLQLFMRIDQSYMSFKYTSPKEE
jgi:hypothetical protein